MRVSDFHFDLPQELIAQHPPAVRGTSRMLVLERRPAPQAPVLTDAHFAQLPEYLRPGDLLVLNDSRVLPSRLFATRAASPRQPGSAAPAARIEVLLTEQLDDRQDSTAADVLAAAVRHPAELASSGLVWRALCRPARKVVPGETLLFFDPSNEAGAPPALSAEVVALGCFGERTLRFAPNPDFYSIVSRIGHMPLPPYIRRDQAHAGPGDEEESEDKTRYQTVYALDPGVAPPGSAAAPTAGLHFTPEMLAALAARGVEIAYLTLHVGLGTFQPVRVAELADIRLHAERYTLPPATADALNRAFAPSSGPPRRIVAVGTTTTRTLEHIAAVADGRPFEPHSGSTSIFLSPGHRFRIVHGLLTNFHLPESTLLMLVAAFTANAPGAPFTGAPFHAPSAPLAGNASTAPTARFQVTDPGLARRQILDVYAHAVRQHYRFFSYGDCMLLL